LTLSKPDQKHRRDLERHYARINKKTPDVSKARADGRPQFYDITQGDRVQCVVCLANGVEAQYKRGEAFMNDPANSPVLDRSTQLGDGAVYSVCKAHIPENSVIYDPLSNECRNKAGDNTWTEKA
jgi:hypothetical protein